MMPDQDRSAFKPGDGLGKLHGRRKGPALRGRQAGLLTTLLPGLEIPQRALDHSALSALFEPGQPPEIWLEVGFGAGEHLVAQAQAHRAVGLIGSEVYVNGIAKLLARIDDTGLTNIRLFTDDARKLLLHLPDRSLARIFVLFPDPWPKTRHHKRRFINDWTLGQMARTLKPGGRLRIASDIPGYIRWTLAHVRRFPEYRWTAERPVDWRIRPADWPATRYEQKAVREGRAPCYLEYIRQIDTG